MKINGAIIQQKEMIKPNPVSDQFHFKEHACKRERNKPGAHLTISHFYSSCSNYFLSLAFGNIANFSISKLTLHPD